MLNSLEIHRFKGLSYCRLENLSRVNLLVGKNNVGKSSLLEAISLLLTKGSMGWIIELLRNRGLSTSFGHENENHSRMLRQNIATLFTGRNADEFSRIPIVILAKETDKTQRSLRLQLGYLVDDTYVDENGNKQRKRTFLRSDQIEDGTEYNPGICIEIDDKDWRHLPLMGYGMYAINAERNIEFVRPSSTFSANNAKLFDRIAMTDMQHWLVKALQIIDPRIRDVNFLSDPLSIRTEFRASGTGAGGERVPIVVLDDSPHRYPLRSMGDGVNRILTIVLSMLNCKGGTLLVDEFENGLHYTTLCQLWEIIFQLAAQLDIQVFVTSHSNDCIRSFIEADTEGEGTIMRLETRPEGIIGVPYADRDELDYINRNNVEIR